MEFDTQQDIRSFLELRDVYIVNINYVGSDKPIKQKIEYTYSFDCHVKPSADIVNVFLKATVSGIKKNILLEIEVCGEFFVNMEGFKSIPHKNKKKLLTDILTKNTVAIVFPYLRTYVSTITGMAGIKEINIPIFNINKALTPVASELADGIDSQENEG